jgi:hypothetical protein
MRLLIPINPYCEQKIVGPLYTVVVDPEKHDLSSKGHLTKQIVFAVFGNYIKINKLHGYSHSKSNFRLKSTHPTML